MKKSQVIIESDRLILRPPVMEDAAPLNQAIYRSLRELRSWMPWASDPSLLATTSFIQMAIAQWQNPHQSNFPMVVFHKQDQIVIGGSGYNEASDPQVPFYSIGYWLDTQYTGLGLATELTIALTRYAFEALCAKRVQICMQADNLKSRRVAEKCGFSLEATLHYHSVNYESGKASDDLVFACFDMQNLPVAQVCWQDL